jgi:hypothetical protein
MAAKDFMNLSFLNILEKLGVGHVCGALFKKHVLIQDSCSKTGNMRKATYVIA